MKRLRIDPIACDGRGLCAELFPERITLDEWGYAIIDQTPIPASLERHAAKAVEACPLLALSLDSLAAREGRARGPKSRR
ncbi:MAG TPA: ferredoxin [Gaiellaceae bacterium]